MINTIKPSISQLIWQRHFWPAIKSGEKIYHLHFKNKEDYQAFLNDLSCPELIIDVEKEIDFQACNIWGASIVCNTFDRFVNSDYSVQIIGSLDYYKLHE